MTGAGPGQDPTAHPATEPDVTDRVVVNTFRHAVAGQTTTGQAAIDRIVAGPSGGGVGWSGSGITPSGQDRLGPVFAEGSESSSEAERVAEAVLAVPGVARLHGGAFGEVATYLPGRQVRGVRMAPDDPRAAGGPGRVEVHVVARYPMPVAAVAAEIRVRLTSLAGSRAVDVYVEDYIVAGEPPEVGTGSTPSGR